MGLFNSRRCWQHHPTLQDNLELLASLTYPARQGNTDQQRRYMARASDVIEEMRHHPKLRE
jgi:hypothetical protein